MTSSSSSAISPGVLGVQPGGATTQTTTKRALILKQIEALQKQLGGLYKQLQALDGKYDPNSIEDRIQLQQQIESVEKEIKELQGEMVQQSADEKVQVRGNNKAAGAASSDTAATDGSTSGAAPAGSGGALSTVGSVINTQA